MIPAVHNKLLEHPNGFLLLSPLSRLLHLPGQVDVVGQVIVQVGESNFILRPDGLPDDNFVDVIKFIPVFIPQMRRKEIVIPALEKTETQIFLTKDAVSASQYLSQVITYLSSKIEHLLKIDISNERLELGPSRNSHVQCLGGEECFQVKQIEVVVIHQVSEQLICQPVQCGHHGQGELPPLVRGTIDIPAGKQNGTLTVQPKDNWSRTKGPQITQHLSLNAICRKY